MGDTQLERALLQFQTSLTADERQRFHRFHSDGVTVKTVVELTRVIDQCESQKKGRVFASRVSTVLDSIREYCQVLDIAVGPNTIASGVWSCVKLCLLVTLKFIDYFDKVSQKLAQISSYCPRLNEYGVLFQESQRVQVAIGDLYAIIVTFCAKALDATRGKAHIKTMWKTFKRDFGKLEENIAATKNEVDEELNLASQKELFAFKRLLRKIEERQLIECKEQEAYRLRQADESRENQIFRSLQLLNAEASSSSQARQELLLKETKELDLQKQERKRERERARLLDSIHTYDYEFSLREAWRIRLEGTGSWLLCDPGYIEWLEKSEVHYIWCCGIAGCGKTILAGLVVHQLKLLQPLYFFFSSKSNQSLSVETFLSSILHQLLKRSELDHQVQIQVQEIFGIHGKRPAAVDKLVSLVLQLIGSAGCRYLIIDGLDELDGSIRVVVISLLKKAALVNWSLKLFVTSSHDLELSSLLANCHRIYVGSQHVRDDMEHYITHRIREDSSSGPLRVCDGDMLDIIKTSLLSKAGSMFLWVDLQIKALCDVCDEDGSSKRIPSLLARLPKDIVEMYSRILAPLVDDDSTQGSVVKKIFQWVIKAKRPLTSIELEAAISIEPGQKYWAEPTIKLDPTRLSRRCGNLIIYDHVEQIVKVAHHSVVEFLELYCSTNQLQTFQLQPLEWDSSLGRTCLTHLCFRNMSSAVDKTSRNYCALSEPLRFITPITSRPFIHRLSHSLFAIGPHGRQAATTKAIATVLRSASAGNLYSFFPLLDYSTKNWFHHTAAISVDDKTAKDLIRHLLNEPNLPFGWEPWDISSVDLEPVEYWTMFSWAVQNGQGLVIQAWEDSVPVSVQNKAWELVLDQFGSIALTNIVSMRRGDILVLITSKLPGTQLEPESVVFYIQLGLIEAARLGHSEIFHLLLKEFESIFTRMCSNYAGKHTNKWKKILSRFAIPEEEIDENIEGFIKQVRNFMMKLPVLIKTGPKKAAIMTPLSAAAEGGHLDLVEELLGCYVYPNLDEDNLHIEEFPNLDKDNLHVEELESVSALSRAAGAGHLSVVKRLLEVSADPNQLSEPLYAAAKGGYLAVVEQLLKHQPNYYLLQRNLPIFLDGQDGVMHGDASIFVATKHGHAAVVDRLLRDVPDEHDRNLVVCVAANYGHATIVQMLLGSRSSFPISEFFIDNALHKAARGGFLSIVSMLLETGWKARTKNERHETPFELAAAGGHTEVVEKLIDFAANHGERPWDAMVTNRAVYLAAQGGHTSTVDLLLRKTNADPFESVTFAYEVSPSALKIARKNGHTDVVNTILRSDQRWEAFTKGASNEKWQKERGGIRLSI